MISAKHFCLRPSNSLALILTGSFVADADPLLTRSAVGNTIGPSSSLEDCRCQNLPKSSYLPVEGHGIVYPIRSAVPTVIARRTTYCLTFDQNGSSDDNNFGNFNPTDLWTQLQ